jgi:hypothetical protein
MMQSNQPPIQTIPIPTGANPFAQSGTSLKDRGKYQVHISLKGDQGYPNELPTIAKGKGGFDGLSLIYKWISIQTPNTHPVSHISQIPQPQTPPGSNATGAFLLLRVYAYDKQSPNKTNIWGAVPPPVVRYKVSQWKSSRLVYSNSVS